jgi:catechol 2,3-dioxygenase-like lactoylglutathione lyase family enzyme
MAHAINHVHIRATDPHRSAKWYEQYFGAKVLAAREVLPNTITITMDAGGPVRLNISSPPPGSSEERASAELNRLGLEHFGFSTDDIEADIARFEDAGVRIVMPIRDIGGGAKIAYIEGPDDVLIELVQSGA